MDIFCTNSVHALWPLDVPVIGPIASRHIAIVASFCLEKIQIEHSLIPEKLGSFLKWECVNINVFLKILPEFGCQTAVQVGVSQ